MDDIRVLRAVVLVMAVAALLTATVLDGLLMRYVMRPFIRQMLERSGGTPYPPSIMFMVSGSRLGVLRTARHVLGALLGMLRADSTTNARGEIGALDFDPLLNSQDPCESYQAGPATQIGDRWDVPVFAVCGGNRASTGEVIVELEERRPAWMIRNLRYPALDSDLRAVLRGVATGIGGRCFSFLPGQLRAVLS